MITREQALTLIHNEYIHANGCTRTIGPRGGVKTSIERYRVASRVQTWKTRPNDFAFTVKFSIYNRTYTIDHANAYNFHLESECPLNLDTGLFSGLMSAAFNSGVK